MNFAGVEKIAAAILYEGYILYPYRPTSIKNRQRWNFGTVYPRVYAEAQRPQDQFRLVAECLLIADAQASLDVKLNFLQLVRQSPSAISPSSEDSNRLSDSLAGDEAIERTSEHPSLSLGALIASPHSLRLQSDPTSGLEAVFTIEAEVIAEQLCKLHLELQNVSSLINGDRSKRDEALLRSFVSAHVLLGI